MPEIFKSSPKKDLIQLFWIPTNGHCSKRYKTLNIHQFKMGDGTLVVEIFPKKANFTKLWLKNH